MNRETARARTAGGRRAAAEGAARRRVLFVDDSADIATCWRAALERCGYSVESCSDPRAAIRIAASDPGGIDLLLTDLSMPHMTGVELARQVRRVCPGLPVVLCTGYADADQRRLAFAAGISAIVEKPVRLPDLVVTLDAMLGG